MKFWKFNARWGSQKSNIGIFKELNFVFVKLGNSSKQSNIEKKVKENDVILIVEYDNDGNQEIKGIGIADNIITTIKEIISNEEDSKYKQFEFNDSQKNTIRGVKLKRVYWKTDYNTDFGILDASGEHFHQIHLTNIINKVEEFLKSKKMKYWTFKHQPGTEANENDSLEFVKKAIRLNSALMQYEYTRQIPRMVTLNWNIVSEVKEGDYIFLRGNTLIYAVGRAIKPRKKADERLKVRKIIQSNSHGEYISGEYDGVIHFDECEVFYEELTSEKEDNWGQRIDVESWMYYFPLGIDAQSKSHYVEGSNDFGVIKELKQEAAINFIKELKNKFMGKEIKILESNKNIVLTGAPGTGKTYLAKEIALKMIFGKDKEDLLSDDEKENLKTQLAFVQFHPSYDYTDFIEGLRPDKPNKEGKEISFKLTNGIFKEFCKNALKEYKKGSNSKFVFIIDEINRGELSKIFGELFYSIDPGYRGSVGSVKTQYHNINAPDDFVDSETESFYVPENVYVVGTMNDIDRSVESIDFAMRRRFAWIEVKPEDRISMWDGNIDNNNNKAAKKKMNAINEIIKNENSLGEHYQIGPSYFLKLKGYNGDFSQLWDNHIAILIKEYLRGTPKSETIFQSIKTAYDANN